jgi:hypothetical protein
MCWVIFPAWTLHSRSPFSRLPLMRSSARCPKLGVASVETASPKAGAAAMGAALTGDGASQRGKSAAAATLSMATSPAATITIIFTIANPLVMGTRTDRPSHAPIRPFGPAAVELPTAAFSLLRRPQRGALPHSK